MKPPGSAGHRPEGSSGPRSPAATGGSFPSRGAAGAAGVGRRPRYRQRAGTVGPRSAEHPRAGGRRRDPPAAALRARKTSPGGGGGGEAGERSPHTGARRGGSRDSGSFTEDEAVRTPSGGNRWRWAGRDPPRTGVGGAPEPHRASKSPLPGAHAALRSYRRGSRCPVRRPAGRGRAAAPGRSAWCGRCRDRAGGGGAVAAAAARPRFRRGGGAAGPPCPPRASNTSGGGSRPP